MPSLPELSHRELVKLLRHFGCTIKNPKAPQLIGCNRHGEPFSFHLHPSHKAYPELVGKIIKRIRITPDEFWSWYNKGR